MEKRYRIKCLVCETETEVIVQDESERPGFCAMCGFASTEVEYEEVDDD